MKKSVGLILIIFGIGLLLMRLNKKYNPVDADIEDQISAIENYQNPDPNNKEAKSSEARSNVSGGDVTQSKSHVEEHGDQSWQTYDFDSRNSLADFLYNASSCSQSTDLVVCETKIKNCILDKPASMDKLNQSTTCITSRGLCDRREPNNKVSENKIDYLYSRWLSDQVRVRFELMKLKSELESEKNCPSFDYEKECEVTSLSDCLVSEKANVSREVYGKQTWVCQPKGPKPRCLVQ